MFCGKCGNELKDGERYCRKCGTPTRMQPEINEHPEKSDKKEKKTVKKLLLLLTTVLLLSAALFVVSKWFIKKQDTISHNKDFTASEGDSYIDEPNMDEEANVTDAEESQVIYNPQISDELFETATNVRNAFYQIGISSIAGREQLAEKLGIKIEKNVEDDFLYNDWVEMLIDEETNEIIVNMSYSEEEYHIIIKPSDGEYIFSVVAAEPGFVKMEQTPAAINFLCKTSIHNKYSKYDILRKLDTYDAETDEPLDECMEFTEFKGQNGNIFCYPYFSAYDEDYMYPITLCSETDGENLVQIYLDAERDEEGNVLRYLKRVIEFEPEESEYGYQVKSLRTEELELKKYVEKLKLEDLDKKIQKLSFDSAFWDCEEDELEEHLNQWEDKMYELIDLVGEQDSDVKQNLEDEFREYLKEARDELEESVDDESYAWVYWDISRLCRTLCYKLIHNGLIENQMEACYPAVMY